MKKILCAVVAVIGMFIIPAMADETCDGKLYSGTWNQQVTNGNFANSTSSWNMMYGTGTVENNVLHFVNTTSQGVPNQHYNKFIVGNKYLITAQIKGSSSGSIFGAGGGADTTAAIKFNITNENEYKKLSAIVVPVKTNATFYFYLTGAEGSIFDIKNVMAFDLTQMFGAGNEPATAEEAERLIPVIASSLNISATDGYYATNTGQAYSYCATIKIATTKYNETAFGPLNTALQNAISVVDTVVSNTITQAGRIATLQTQKQTRPADDPSDANNAENCPAGKKCLLVEDASGIPHWYEIVENAWDLPVGYTQLQYIESTGTQYIDTGIIATNWDWSVEFEMSVPQAGDMFFGAGRGLWGSAEWGAQFGLANSSGNANWGFGSGGMNVVISNLGVRTNTFYNYKITKEGLYVNGELKSQNTATESFSNSNLSLWICKTNNPGTSGYNKAGSSWKYVRIYNADTALVFNGVPAKNPDGKIGMYDKVSGAFFENKGTGEFIAGPVVQ